MELKNLVELLYTAYQRFTTVQVSWSYAYNVALMQVAEQRWVEMNPPGSVAVLTAALTTEAKHNTQVQTQKRVWWQKPACWREEQVVGNKNSTTTILCDGQWWSFSSSQNTLYTNAAPDEEWLRSGMRVEKGHPPDLRELIIAVPFLDPSFLLTSHQLEFVAEGVHAERAAVQVRAVYHKRQEYLHEAFFWATADEYRLLIDKEYGVLLRYAAIINGTEYAVSAIEHIVFDAPIPPETFVFTI